MTDDLNRFNGWANKETWLINLWLGDLFSSMVEEGEEVTADTIEQLVDELVEQKELDGFLLDLMNCATGSVDYHELAEAFMADAPEKDEDDEG